MSRNPSSPHRLSRSKKLLGHLKRNIAAEGISGQTIWAVRLAIADLAKIVGSHVFDPREVRTASIQTLRLQSKHRLVVAEATCQSIEADDLSAQPRDEEKR